MSWQDFRRTLREARKDTLQMSLVEFAQHLSTPEITINKNSISRLENAGKPGGIKHLKDCSVRQTLTLIAPYTHKPQGGSYSVDELITLAYDEPLPSLSENIVPETEGIEHLGKQMYHLIKTEFDNISPIKIVQALSVAQLVALNQPGMQMSIDNKPRE
ncbi:hypothetical protein QPK87_25190 [Kamptonema cortianum]|nr:hypothetical protein [Desertifilum sp.]MDI9636190.1 hypothetical protein [Geitlerinema splendidum]MDK3159830.1 hypothetical protein [Kamptonema cortianum]